MLHIKCPHRSGLEAYVVHILYWFRIIGVIINCQSWKYTKFWDARFTTFLCINVTVREALIKESFEVNFVLRLFNS